MHTKESLKKQLAAMGLTGEETILIHSSMKAIGETQKGDVYKRQMYNIFNYEKGIVNAVLKMAGMAPFDLYNTPGAWPVSYTHLDVYKRQYRSHTISV